MNNRFALTTLFACLLTLCVAAASRAQGLSHHSLSDQLLGATRESQLRADAEFNQERELARYIAVGSLFAFGGFFIWLRSK